MKEERFERIIESKNPQYDVKNLTFNLIITIISAIIVLLTNNFLAKVVLGVIIFIDLSYFMIMILDIEVYWRRIK